MANNRTITAANSIFLLSIASLYLTPQRVQGFSMDAGFDLDAREGVETQMGIDGRLSAGFVAKESKMSVTLAADSLSNDLFDAWDASQRQLREALEATGSVTIPGLRKRFTLTRGFLTSFKPLAGTGKTLQPRTHVITWQAADPAPI